MKLSVVIPSYNEMGNLRKGTLDKVATYLERKKYDYEITQNTVEFSKQTPDHVNKNLYCTISTFQIDIPQDSKLINIDNPEVINFINSPRDVARIKNRQEMGKRLLNNASESFYKINR